MSYEPDEQYKQDAYLNQKLITREILEASSDRTWIHLGTSHREHRQANTSSKLFPHSPSHYYLQD